MMADFPKTSPNSSDKPRAKLVVDEVAHSRIAAEPEDFAERATDHAKWRAVAGHLLAAAERSCGRTLKPGFALESPTPQTRRPQKDSVFDARPVRYLGPAFWFEATGGSGPARRPAQSSSCRRTQLGMTARRPRRLA